MLQKQWQPRTYRAAEHPARRLFAPKAARGARRTMAVHYNDRLNTYIVRVRSCIRLSG